MPSRIGTIGRRFASVLTAVACLMVLLPLTGCFGPLAKDDPDDTPGVVVTGEYEAREAARAKADAERKKPYVAPPTGVTMFSEEGEADPLVGGWSYTGMNYTPANKQWGKGKLWPDTELHTVTFVKQGEIYSLQGSSDYTVTFDGTNVTITGGPADSLQSKYSGVLEGDTITGTRHHVGGKLVYDGPWAATRAK